MITETTCSMLESSSTYDDYKMNTGVYKLTHLEPEWSQTTLYTRVLVNIKKWMKNNQFCSACFSINIWIFERGNAAKNCCEKSTYQQL